MYQRFQAFNLIRVLEGANFPLLAVIVEAQIIKEGLVIENKKNLFCLFLCSFQNTSSYNKVRGVVQVRDSIFIHIM